MGRVLSNIFVCISFCLACCAGAAAQDRDFIRVVIDPNYSPAYTYATGSGSPRLPDGYALARHRARSPRMDTCHGSCPLPVNTGIRKVQPPVPQYGFGSCMPPMPVELPCILPRRQCGQTELEAQIFYARLSGRLGKSHSFIPGGTVEADFNLDMRIPDRAWVQEYSARCQFQPHWGVLYSIMLVRELNLTYQRVGLIYDAVSICNAKLSVFGAWLFNEQRLSYVHDPVCGSSRRVVVDPTRHMVQAGVELQRCIKTLCSGATISCDNRVGLGFLDNTFNLDVQAGFRFNVPLGGQRWGYVRGGYRLVEFSQHRRDLTLDTHLEGGFGELGIIF